MDRSVLVFLVALLTCCMCEKFVSQTIPAVVHEVCPSAEEREAITEQIDAVVRERISKQILFLLANSSNCCEVCTTHIQVRPIGYMLYDTAGERILLSY